MKILYPEISPYHTFYLETGSQHLVYVEESGTPEGIPVIFLHGGPCSGTRPHHRQFFNPEKYRIILMDQRGSGLSTPYGELKNNTTQDLLNDMEAIRQQLSINQWLLFGGSWGATLALLYAQQYPKQVTGMILRGTFLARKKDLDWYLKIGVSHIYPEAWQDLIKNIPLNYHHNLLEGLYFSLNSEDELTQRRTAKAWLSWGGQIALGNLYQEDQVEHVTEKMLEQVKMELHYAINHYFIADNQILAQCSKLHSMPTIIIHGRYDLVCPMDGAMSLHHALPDAQYIVLPHSGHIAQGDEMINALVSSTDTMANILA